MLMTQIETEENVISGAQNATDNAQALPKVKRTRKGNEEQKKEFETLRAQVEALTQQLKNAGLKPQTEKAPVEVVPLKSNAYSHLCETIEDRYINRKIKIYNLKKDMRQLGFNLIPYDDKGNPADFYISVMEELMQYHFTFVRCVDVKGKKNKDLFTIGVYNATDPICKAAAIECAIKSFNNSYGKANDIVLNFLQN